MFLFNFLWWWKLDKCCNRMGVGYGIPQYQLALSRVAAWHHSDVIREQPMHWVNYLPQLPDSTHPMQAEWQKNHATLDLLITNVTVIFSLTCFNTRCSKISATRCYQTMSTTLIGLVALFTVNAGSPAKMDLGQGSCPDHHLYFFLLFLVRLMVLPGGGLRGWTISCGQTHRTPFFRPYVAS